MLLLRSINLRKGLSATWKSIYSSIQDWSYNSASMYLIIVVIIYFTIDKWIRIHVQISPKTPNKLNALSLFS